MDPHILERRTCRIDEKIFVEGGEGDRAYIIQDGLIEISHMKDGQPASLGTLGKGAIFGEMALLDDRPRMATATAVDPTTLIVINREMFDAKMKKTDPFIRGLLKILADNVRDAHHG